MKQTRVQLKHLLLSSTLLAGLAISIPTAAAAAGHGHPTTGPGHFRTHLYNATSTNWAGYATLTSLTNPKSGSVTDASGNWTVPTANCAANASHMYSATWLGLDGYSDQTVEQTGTEQDCQGTKPVYSAWYEMYPNYAHTVRMSIHAGDQMQAEVKYDNWYFYTLTLKDVTTGVTMTTNQMAFGAQLQSAEWITEAPSDYAGILPLTKLSPVTFTNAATTVGGTTGSISMPSGRVDDPITLVNAANKPILTPSPLTSNGTSFTLN